jgi:hypothetical protein
MKFLSDLSEAARIAIIFGAVMVILIGVPLLLGRPLW